ncbi:MAG: imidazolonepropionase [Gammaproteobacteria bacterium]|nr:imidazolonepropionase [Gammaproteobacteria bacterium]
MSEKRRYTHISKIEGEILEMIEQGKSHKEIEAFYHLEGDRPVHNLLKRIRKKQDKIEAGVPLRHRGRPPKGYKRTEKEKDFEIKRLKMENELLRDFLQVVGRR